MKKFFGKIANAIKKFFNMIGNAIKKLFRVMKNKWLLKGTTTVILVAIVIAGYIGINWAVEKLDIEDWDFTTKKLYSLSDDTKERLNALEDEITIELINMKDYVYQDYYSGKTLIDGNYIIEYVHKYKVASNKIKVEEINDLDTRVDLQNEYGITSEDAIIVIKNGEDEKVLTINELVTYDYEVSEYIDTTEEAITNGLMEVTIEDKPQIYVFNGNTYWDAKQSMALIANGLIREANNVELLDILTKGNVPEDCDCLIITTLKQDLSVVERDEIIKYINNGGNLLMLTSQSSIDIDTPNLNQVLEQYGITLGYGVVYEQDSDKKLANASNLIVADASASFLKDMDMSLRMFLMNAGNIQFAEETKLEELGVTYETIASTSESSFVRTNFNQNSQSRTDSDSEEGAYIVGAYVNKKISEEKSSQLIIYSDEIFASTGSYSVLQMGTYAFYLYNNEDVVLNSVSHLTERQDTIIIRKTDESQTYAVTEQEDAIIKTIIIVVPVLIIMIGIAVWIFRRRKI